MQRNIVTTIKFSSNQIAIVAIEQLSNSVFEIFNDSHPLQNSADFLTSSLNEIKSKIGGKIKDISVVLEENSKVDMKYASHEAQIYLPSNSVSSQDITNLRDLTKYEFISEGRQVISIQPVKFTIQGSSRKVYNKAPLNKNGERLSMLSIVSTISSEVYNYVTNLLRPHDLNILQVLTVPQALSQTCLSEDALSNGSVLINIGEKRSFIALNKKLATFSSAALPQFGFHNLIKAVAKVFDCSYNEAQQLIIAYGSLLKNDQKYVIYSKVELGVAKNYHNDLLNKVIASFFQKLLWHFKLYLQEMKIENLPIVLTGELTHLDGLTTFVKIQMGEEYVSTYSPLSYAETKKTNWETIGIVNFMKRIDNVMGKQFDTFVETNPATITSLLKASQSSGIFKKLKDLIGVKNVWE